MPAQYVCCTSDPPPMQTHHAAMPHPPTHLSTHQGIRTAALSAHCFRCGPGLGADMATAWPCRRGSQGGWVGHAFVGCCLGARIVVGFKRSASALPPSPPPEGRFWATCTLFRRCASSLPPSQVLGDVHIVQEVCIGTVFFISGLVLNTQELKKVSTVGLLGQEKSNVPRGRG